MLELTLFNSSSREIRQYNAVIFSLSMIAPDSNRLTKSIIHQVFIWKKPRFWADDFKCSCLKKQFSCFMKVIGVCLPLSRFILRKAKTHRRQPGHSSPPVAKVTKLSRMTIYSTNPFSRSEVEISPNTKGAGKGPINETNLVHIPFWT